MDILSVISHEEFMPHGVCLLWRPGLVWPSVASDILITLSYYSIPVALIWFVGKRSDFEHRWILVLFAAFILLCGTTHLLGAILIWQPLYYLEVAVKAATALVSVFTAIVMWPLIPKLLAMPSQSQLERAHAALKESEERYRQLSEASFEGIVIAVDGKIMDANSAFAATFGYTREEIIGKSALDLTPSDWQAVVMDHIRHASAEVYDAMGLKKDGTLFSIEIRGRAIMIRGQKGRITAIRDITERKAAEEALRQSEETFRALFNAITETVFIMDRGGVVLAINETGARRLGKRAEEVVGKNIFQIIPEEVARRRMKVIEQVFESGETVRMEDQRGNIWFDQTYYPVKDAAGHATMLATFAIDVTAQKEAEEILRFHSAILKNLAEGIYLIRLSDGIIVFVNPQFERMFGYEPGEMLGKNVSIVNAPSEKSPEATASGIISELVRTGRWNGDVRNIKKDGTVFWCHANVTIFDHFQHGQVIAAVHEDITERKRADDALRNSVAKWKGLFSILPVGVSIIDNQHGIKEFNQELGDLLDLPAERLDDGKIQKRKYLRGDNTPMTPEEFPSKIAIDEQRIVRHVEIGVVKEDGVTVWTDVSAAPLPPPDACVIVTANMTERKAKEEKLEKVMTELEHANQELQEFVYIASHDLQEPLRKVTGFGDRLKKHLGSVLDEKGTDYLARMTSAAERMSQLIEDLLAFSRVTTRTKPFERVDLSAILKEVLEDMEIAVSEADATVATDPMPVIDADPTQMRQLLQNLIGNSVKFCPINKPCRIAIRAALNNTGRELRGTRFAAGELILINVEDNGIGFDEKYAEQIFGVFQRLHGKGKYKGTGVGLAICKKIVERHEGKIEVSSKPGEGSRFTVILPIHHKTLEGK